ncbi:MAG TPA: 2-amino-4-hydroxy-6-hydroxymethyldihydropteridine diphosphokinase [Burkholderiales bacterium]|nr:2-amino-4-hydroxy-6-hydroxymethyldihydropteridine diphosphokinase [Burkholderiales bacterium]
MSADFLHRAYVGIGSNLEEPVRQVRQATCALHALPGTRSTARSSLYRSAPIGKLDQPDFINAVVQLETELSPAQLLAQLLAIEARHGRIRTERNAARTLDLDLLLYDQLMLDTPTLALPHPRMHERAFVLLPLCEIDPGIHVPGRGPVSALLAALGEQRITRLED